ncbi:MULTISPECIES: ABC transporter ATP-binding protein [Metallibacterium]|jgi:ABC-2 type transport system ATP-binding protein|uniref:ABC transporter ATP-binding protein n=1 Tax=Metallibacterium TaxID=1218803 RepID=UPI002628B579|nr:MULTISPECIES: ABC transporter ATP-binding protein [Metallibacterium]MBW8075668.1 ATP-binding cassette domain-containing protein [Metallibacterium scheffleri]
MNDIVSAPARTQPDALRASLLVKAFDGREVLCRLDWEVPQGRVVGLLGRNGAGKTTLLRCLLGLSPVDAGSIEILGEPMDEPRGERLHRIGYVPQSFDLFPWMKVGDFLAFTAAFYRRWDTALVERLLTEWQLDRKKKIAALSQGQRQMLAIVRALAPDPDLLVLDEPVASLDPIARRDFLATLLPLVRRPGKTVIFSTHITTDLERVDADIALLRGGRIALMRPLSELRAQLRGAVLTRAAGFTAAPALEDALSARVREGQARYVIDTGNAGIAARLQALAAREDARLELAPLDLEDLFVELA